MTAVEEERNHKHLVVEMKQLGTELWQKGSRIAGCWADVEQERWRMDGTRMVEKEVWEVYGHNLDSPLSEEAQTVAGYPGKCLHSTNPLASHAGSEWRTTSLVVEVGARQAEDSVYFVLY